jgi:hypothetical protein
MTEGIPKITVESETCVSARSQEFNESYPTHNRRERDEALQIDVLAGRQIQSWGYAFPCLRAFSSVGHSQRTHDEEVSQQISLRLILAISAESRKPPSP